MVKHQIYPQLLKMAEWRVKRENTANQTRQKEAFVPPAGDPAAGGGAPPMDPMAAGGGAPPMDPMAAGAMPPGDPAMAAGGAVPPMDPMAGGMPPGGGGGAVPPEIQAAIDQAVQAAMGGQGGAGAGAGAGPGAGGAKKIDPAFIYMELSRVRKLLTNLHQQANMPMPPDILDDQTVAQTMAGQQPQSQPLEQSAGEASPGLPSIGGQAPISPVEPVKTAADMLDIPKSVEGPITSTTFREQGERLDMIGALARSLYKKNAR